MLLPYLQSNWTSGAMVRKRSTIILAFTSCGLVIVAWLAGIATFNLHRTSQRTTQIVDELDKMPSWLSVGRPGDVECDRIEESLCRINQYKTHDIRRAIVISLHKYRNSPNELSLLETKIFLLTRFIFNIPAMGAPNPAPGWLHDQYPTARSPDWPFQPDNSGNPHIADVFHGFSGPKYQPLEDFDFYFQKGTRRVSKKECDGERK